MAINNVMLAQRSLFDITNIMNRLAEVQNKVSSGRKIITPSDDPVGINEALSLRQEQSKLKQYGRNVERGVNDIEASSQGLEFISNALLDIETLVSEIKASANMSTEKTVYVTRISNLLDQVLLSSNKKYLGKFLFGGIQTISGTAQYSAPFNAIYDSNNKIIQVVQNPNGINGVRHTILREGTTFAVNLSGSAIFQPNGSNGANDLFKTIIDLRDAVSNLDRNSIDSLVDNLRTDFERVVSKNSELGSKVIMLEKFGHIHNNTEVLIKDELSKVEDADMAELLIELQLLNNSYMAALQTGAKIMLPSLLNFL